MGNFNTENGCVLNIYCKILDYGYVKKMYCETLAICSHMYSLNGEKERERAYQC